MAANRTTTPDVAMFTIPDDKEGQDELVEVMRSRIEEINEKYDDLDIVKENSQYLDLLTVALITVSGVADHQSYNYKDFLAMVSARIRDIDMALERTNAASGNIEALAAARLDLNQSFKALNDCKIEILMLMIIVMNER